MRFSALLEWLEWAAGVMRTLPGVAARRFPIGTADAKFGMPHRNGDSTNGRKWAIIIFNGNFSFHITLSPCFPFTGLPSCRCETGLAKKNTKNVRGPDWLCSKAKKKKRMQKYFARLPRSQGTSLVTKRRRCNSNGWTIFQIALTPSSAALPSLYKRFPGHTFRSSPALVLDCEADVPGSGKKSGITFLSAALDLFGWEKRHLNLILQFPFVCASDVYRVFFFFCFPLLDYVKGQLFYLFRSGNFPSDVFWGWDQSRHWVGRIPLNYMAIVI